MKPPSPVLLVLACVAILTLQPETVRPAENAPRGPGSQAEDSLEQRLAGWREARLGMFIHWGPSSIRGREIRGSRIGHPHDHPGLSITLPAPERDPLDTVLQPGLAAPAARKFVGGRPLNGPESMALRLDSPVDYQVFQRRTAGEGQVRIAGRVPTGTRKLEANIAGEWRSLAFNKEDGTFDLQQSVPAGGWYRCQVRATGPGGHLGTVEVAHVGVGEVFVVAGQSNSANHGEERQQSRSGLVASFDGSRWQPCQDPQPGASGDGGSFLPPFGDAIAGRFHVPVGLVACGIGATSVREWLPRGSRFPNPPTLVGRVRQLPDGAWESNGEAYAAMLARMRSLGPRGFRAVLWHQGESDANQADASRTLPGPLYRQYLERILRESRSALGWEAPWFVAQVSYHVPGDEASPDIRAAQASLWRDGLALEGPDSDALKGELRDSQGRGVHFSGPGLRAHAEAWANKVAPWLQFLLHP